MRPFSATQHAGTLLRVATYNIHKGVQGLGPVRRLEIHNLGHAVEQLDADVVCLQEVRKVHRREERYFTRWPELPQAEFLCPEGYYAGTKRRGRVSRPRRVLFSIRRGSPAGSIAATWRASAVRTASPSRRAIAMPTQAWMPKPKPR